MYAATVGSRRYTFADLKALMAKATPLRSGDQLAGLAAETGEERVAAQFALADLPLAAFLDEYVVPYEADEVTRLIADSHDKTAFAPVAHLTVGGFRDWLLSDEATINSNPQLEIFADDVKCTHGAAVGQLDEEAMFYLQARGLSRIEARDMLLHAFAGEVLEGLKIPALREQIESSFFAALGRGVELKA